MNRLLLAFGPGPFEKPIGRYKTSSFFEGFPEGRLESYGFEAGIDYLAADLGIFRLERHEPTVQFIQDIASVLVDDGKDFQGRRHVVVIRLYFSFNMADGWMRSRRP